MGIQIECCNTRKRIRQLLGLLGPRCREVKILCKSVKKMKKCPHINM